MKTRLWWMILVIAAAVGAYSAFSGFGAPAPKAGDPVERFHPDDYPPTPQPRQPKVLEGYEAIVLGSDRTEARIVLTVQGRQPKIVLESNRSGERVVCYLTSRGQAVIGITTKQRDQIGAGVFVEDGKGKLLLCDRDGCHVFDGAELERWGRAGNVGALPKK